ncbi:hypothetical protein [Acinetobacter seifertii]|uniref:hypothetical protein n=1 Tax=Acinetobacter seifertii TaxID=1530123 RepID=UPI000A303D70|nr:hypothetical protein [Acinetobacter seifertii]OUC60303.1 hypothetical protein MWQ_06871 [Acinetobacter seifertii]
MYSQPEKKIARLEVIQKAVRTLTTQRYDSTLTPKKHVRKVYDHLLARNGYDALHASKLSDESIQHWEKLYDSLIHKKKAKDLKVAYLSGPNPENDLHEFVKSGILPENIWAFESDLKTYNKALAAIIASKYPFLKIIKSNIADFFKVSPQRFDIIYLDFCGPLPSKESKTLSTLTKIINEHALNSPGVLITNFGLASVEQDADGANLIDNLVATYLYPKPFLERSKKSKDIKEGAIAHSYDYDSWKKHVTRYRGNFYGQFVSRFLFDLIQMIVPYSNFPTSGSIFESMFNIKDKKQFEKDINSIFHFNEMNGGDVISDPYMYSILWSLAACSKEINKEDSDYPAYIYQSNKFAAFCESFFSQMEQQGNSSQLMKNLSKVFFLLSEGCGEEKYYSEKMTELSKINYFPRIYHFCDVVLFHQFKELMLRQLASPYHVNIEKTKRWKYKAKDTTMYMDMIVVDECRYFYDWMPNIGTIEHSIFSDDRLLVLRFVLDGMSQHRHYYTTEMFFGTACVGHDNKGFEAKLLSPRKEIRKI